MGVKTIVGRYRSYWRRLNRPYWRKRIRRHLLLALVGGVLLGGIYYALGLSTATWPNGSLKADGFVWRLGMASAYTALMFLGVTLIIGPWNVLCGRPNPVSTDVRRDVGIWAGLLGLAHVVFGLHVHVAKLTFEVAGFQIPIGRVWGNFLYPPNQPRVFPIRLDLFGFANFLGVGVTLVLIVLLALSNNFSLRKLGTIRWKALQRWNYVGFVLLVVHGAAYQIVEERVLLFVGLYGVIILLVVSFQLAGFRQIRLKQ